MPVYVGGNAPTTAYVGSTAVSAMYVGSTQVFSAATSQTTLATENFSSWSQWTRLKGAAAQFTVASGVGTITPPGTNYQTSRAILTAIAAQTDTVAHVEFMFPNLSEQYLDIGIRAQNTVANNPVAYYTSFYPAAGSTDPNYSLLSSDGTYEANEQKTPITYLANNWYAMDIRARGQRVSVRVWNMTAGASQPFSYDVWMVDTPYSTGYLELGVTSGGSNLGGVKFRNITVKTAVDEPGDTTPYSDTMPTASTVTSSGKNWTLSYSSDFPTNVAEGGFRTAYPSMGSYTEEQGDTGSGTTGGRYSTNKTVSVVNGVLTINQRRISGVPYSAIILPDNYASHQYGRAQFRSRQTDVGGVGGFKFVPLWWPISDSWNDGEIDWPEADHGEKPRPATASVPPTYKNPPTNDDRRFYPDGIAVPADGVSSEWHVYTVDWAPDAITYYQDGKVVMRMSNPKGIPTKPMRFALQAETWLGNRTVPTGAVGKVEVDWVAIYNLA